MAEIARYLSWLCCSSDAVDKSSAGLLSCPVLKGSYWAALPEVSRSSQRAPVQPARPLGRGRALPAGPAGGGPRGEPWPEGDRLCRTGRHLPTASVRASPDHTAFRRPRAFFPGRGAWPRDGSDGAGPRGRVRWVGPGGGAYGWSGEPLGWGLSGDCRAPPRTQTLPCPGG